MTIFALASGRGRAGVAVMRISGAGAGPALSVLCSGRASPAALPHPRRASVRTLQDPATGAPIDRALVLWFPAPDSFTGEDVAEVHMHGGRAVIEWVVAALMTCPGLRPAEPGEFTRRAFEHGKLDLTEAEGLADLVNAETEAQRRQAFQQFDGALGRLYEDWRGRLIEALAEIEAAIDFSDEALPDGLIAGARHAARALHAEMAAHLDDGHRGERLRDGIRIAVLGPPNVGKSSLFNALARRDAAIVSSLAGTTRDLIEVHLDLDGYPLTVIDTAGLRAPGDDIEGEGVRRARQMAEAADLRLVLVDARDWPEMADETAALIDDRALLVVNKIDLSPVDAGIWNGVPVHGVSARTGAGLAALVSALGTRVADLFEATAGAGPGLTRRRHRQALEAACVHLDRALTADDDAAELIAEDLRLAARDLGRITGRVDVEDILDVVFRDFCIGK